MEAWLADGWMHGWLVRWMNGWMDRGMGGWTDISIFLKQTW